MTNETTSNRPAGDQQTTSNRPQIKKDNNDKEREEIIVNALQQKFIECTGSTNLTHIQECISFLEDLPYEVITSALEKATVINGPKWKYAKSILNNWISKGIDTIEKVIEDDKNFNNKKSKSTGTTDWEELVNKAIGDDDSG